MLAMVLHWCIPCYGLAGLTCDSTMPASIRSSERRVYQRLLARSRRASRNPEDAADLLQDALVAALAAQREPLRRAEDERWLCGVIRNLAAQRARGEVRRRRREAASAGPEPVSHADSSPQPGQLDAMLVPMPPAARAVAILILHGLNVDEIRWIYGLSEAAFRQRLTSIRKALTALPAELRGEALATALHRRGLPGLELGLIRRALRTTLDQVPGIGTHDPDGHLIVVSSSAHKTRVGGN
jgi:DNA-directed RNA polymerase specialized sigma24 family protein